MTHSITFGQVLGAYAGVGLITTLGFLLILHRTTKRAETLAESSTRFDSRNEAGGQRSAAQFYQAPALPPTTSESLCGACAQPASDVGILSTAGFCGGCTHESAVSPLADLSDMEIPVRRLA